MANSSAPVSDRDQDAPPDGFSVCEIEIQAGVWKPLALDTLPQLISSQEIQPNQHARYYKDGEWCKCLVCDLPGVPRRELALGVTEKYKQVVGEKAKGKLELLPDTILSEIESLRPWAGGGEGQREGLGPSEEGDASRAVWSDEPHETLLDRASRFSRYLDFIEALCRELIGDEEQALQLYGYITAGTPESVGSLLWYCASHQQACLQIRRGGELGIRRLCDLVKMIERDDAVCLAATYYSFAELLRHFSNLGFSQPCIDRTLRELKPEEWEISPDRDWREVYGSACEEFSNRDRALGQIDELPVMWPGQPAPWEKRRDDLVQRTKSSYGVLTTLGAQDVVEEFAFADPELRAKHRRLQALLAHIRLLIGRGMLSEAEAVLDHVAKGVKGDTDETLPGFIVLEAEVGRLREHVKQLADAEKRDAEREAEKRLFQRVKALETLSVAEAEVELADIKAMATETMPGCWDDLLKKARDRLKCRKGKEQRETVEGLKPTLMQLIQEKKYKEARLMLQQLRLPDELAQQLLSHIVEQEMKATLSKGIEAMGTDAKEAEAHLSRARHLAGELPDDEGQAAKMLIAPMLTAATLFEVGVHDPLADLPDLPRYRDSLYKRLIGLVDSNRYDAETRNQVWNEVSKFAEWVSSCARVGEEVTGQLIESLAKDLESRKFDAEALDRLEKIVIGICRRDPTQYLFDSPGWIALRKLKRARLIAEAIRSLPPPDDDRPDRFDSAAQNLQQAIKLDPGQDDAWERLVECRIRALAKLSPGRQPVLLREIMIALGQLTDEQREQEAHDPERWIDSQIGRSED